MFDAPAVASLKLGGFSTRSLALNMHYSNLGEEAGFVDTSGFRMHFTNKSRLHTMGVISPIIKFVDVSIHIPPNKPRHFLARRCVVSGLEDGESVNIYDTSYHAHITGSEMYSEIYTPTASAPTALSVHIGSDVHSMDKQTVWSEPH